MLNFIAALLFILSLSPKASTAAPEPVSESISDQPPLFYRDKPKLMTELIEDRAIMVSVRAGDNPDYKPGMPESLKQSIRGVVGGVVNAPLKAAVKIVSDYEALPRADDHFEEAKWNLAKSELYVHGAVFGFHARMTLKLRIEDTEGTHRVHWESINGSFLGMKGVVELRDCQRHKTEMALTALFLSSKLPLPKILMGFGLEVVAQRIAGKLRQYIENEYKAGKIQ